MSKPFVDSESQMTILETDMYVTKHTCEACEALTV